MNARRSRRDRRLPVVLRATLGVTLVGAVAALGLPAGAHAKPVPPAQPTVSPSDTPSPTPTTSPSPTPDGSTPTEDGPSTDGDVEGSGEEPSEEVEPSPEETTPEEEDPEAPPPDPLEVTIERLTPSTVPQRGNVVVTGTVRNTSDSGWSDLAVYLLTSAEPMTTADELREAVASDPRTEVGARIIEPGLYVDLPALDPGEARRYRLSVPRADLGISGAPGVYWLGVHVLGTSDEGRLEGADGRARTFLPLVPPRTDPIEVGLGLQLRHRTVRRPNGSLAGPRSWQRALAEDGRLRRLVDLGSTAGPQPLTWIVDPAVVDAALSISRGNPSLGLDPAPAPDLTAGGATADPTVPEPEDEEQDPDADDEDEPDPTALASGDWLTDLVAALGSSGDDLLSLPYGDLDVSAVTRNGVDALVEAAFVQGDRLMEELGVGGGRRVLAPAGGFLSPAAVTRTDPQVPVVLDREAVPSAAGRTVVDRTGGGEVLLVPGPEALDGPTPGSTRSALAVRQRLLADAALEALAPGPEQPLVRLLPADWDPGESWERARFFEGLDVPWIADADLGDLLDRPASGPEVDPGEHVAYPAEQAAHEVPSSVVGAALELVDAGALLDELLTENDQVLAATTRQALLGPSTWSRLEPRAAGRRTRAAERRVERWLAQVSVRGPAFVTMSSESGTFQVQLVNGLDQPVTVGLRTAVSGGQLELSSPGPVELGPQGRAAVQIDARSSDIGVHQVVLQPVSASGTRVGSVATIDVRSSRVGFIVWVVMAVGGTLLFVAIVARLVRRVARRRRTHGPVLKQGAS